ncbi:rod shape-determining protein MreC [Algoriphagus sp.]|jgi:rod shape-determining protein MreC|uniref:rod shape-determining protein MreC n=1 Tax=Algoriphagus sp. TaxID=1872435 RepID=UPI00271D9FDC|nr:rod shape-determining protein MreC [Algoriphagus sp.]MDO8966632.1 rod shape-determining protein MreC [Algoriphagus sp.]MDP3202144.1 rod shape-determining protein MreC [Algoriphagus sp.]
MLRILQFLYRIRAFILFVFLEVLAIWMIVSNNSPQGAAFFNSSNVLIGSVLKKQADVIQFFSLAEANEALTSENAEILQQLRLLQIKPDSISFVLDSALAATYQFKGGRVIGNSLRFSQNYLTLNKGSKHGIKPGMGIFNPEGVVGRVKSVSENYSVAFSLLNTGLLVSSKIKSSDVFGSVQWDGKSASEARLLFVPRHVKAVEGDTVVTSGFNAVFPEGILIGVISKISPDEKNPNYLSLTVKLSTDFSKVNYVYLVENTLFTELDSLHRQSEISNEY